MRWNITEETKIELEKEKELKQVMKEVKSAEKLKEKAEVLKIKECLKMSLFGKGKISKKFRERAGNLLILPRDYHMIWYEHVKGKRFKWLAMHGGLTEEEMLVPFGVMRNL